VGLVGHRGLLVTPFQRLNCL